jgi:RNA polymerase sigma-70 factor (ECF subfamily)
MVVSVPIDAIHLQRHLLARAESLRGYIATKIPPPLAGSLSAEDVLQETFVAAFRSVHSFVPTGPEALDRWLITIANRKLIDALKTAQRVKRGGQGEELHERPKHTSSLAGLLARLTPSREFSVREAADAVHRALRGLGDDRRQAIRMRFVDGLSLKQIARKMGKSYATVNSLLFHGLRELRSRLGDAAKFFSDARSSDAQPTRASRTPPP